MLDKSCPCANKSEGRNRVGCACVLFASLSLGFQSKLQSDIYIPGNERPRRADRKGEEKGGIPRREEGRAKKGKEKIIFDCGTASRRISAPLILPPYILLNTGIASELSPDIWAT